MTEGQITITGGKMIIQLSLHLAKILFKQISFRITKKTIYILLITSVEIYLSSDLVNSIPVKYFITY